MSEKVSYEILEVAGVINENHESGWKKLLAKVSWCGGAPKWDIRDWSPDRRHMSRGVTLTDQELQQVVDLFRDYKHRRQE